MRDYAPILLIGLALAALQIAFPETAIGAVMLLKMGLLLLLVGLVIGVRVGQTAPDGEAQ